MNPWIGYYAAKLIGKLKSDKHNETLNKWFEKKGIILEHGDEGWINICSNIAVNEPHLITIGQNTTVAGGVYFVTHDNSISKVLPEMTDLFGKIKIGKNCFIGAKAIIMYGVSIADNVIVAAGSVVTHSIEESNVVVAGNPAKIISTWKSFGDKYAMYAWDLGKISREEMVGRTLKGERLVKK